MKQIIATGALLIVVNAAFAGVGLDGDDDSGWRAHLTILNDEHASFEDRRVAEHALMQLTDVEMLRAVFDTLAQPVGTWSDPQPVSHVIHPGLRPSTLVVAARERVFAHLAENAQPVEERHRIFAELFEHAQSRIELSNLIAWSSRNWTSETREHLLKIFFNKEISAHLRVRAGSKFGSMHHSTPRFEYLESREIIIATTWEERGTDFARLMTDRLWTDDPRVNLLWVDWYDHARDRGLQKQHVDRMDQRFGNVSGMYVHSPNMLTPEKQLLEKQRSALEQEARETGDDTKLQEFEAELAAKQQAELEVRIARIDAWIAANRERLEKEAAAYVPPELYECLRP